MGFSRDTYLSLLRSLAVLQRRFSRFKARLERMTDFGRGLRTRELWYLRELIKLRELEEQSSALERRLTGFMADVSNSSRRKAKWWRRLQKLHEDLRKLQADLRASIENLERATRPSRARSLPNISSAFLDQGCDLLPIMRASMDKIINFKEEDRLKSMKRDTDQLQERATRPSRVQSLPNISSAFLDQGFDPLPTMRGSMGENINFRDTDQLQVEESRDDESPDGAEIAPPSPPVQLINWCLRRLARPWHQLRNISIRITQRTPAQH